MDPLVTSALISTGGSLLGGLFGKKKKSGTQDYWNNVTQKFEREKFETAKQQFDRLEQERGRSMQIRTADAKAAGLHPLFALGSSGLQGSPTVTAGGGGGYVGSEPQESGSALGLGLQEAARGAAGYFKQKGIRERALQMHDANLRLLNARTAREETEAMAIDSERKRAEQRALQTFADPNHKQWLESGEIVARGKTPGRGVPLAKRPTVSKPHTSIPLWTEAIGNDGERYTMLNPEFADEVSQVFNAIGVPLQKWHFTNRNNARKLGRLFERWTQ